MFQSSHPCPSEQKDLIHQREFSLSSLPISGAAIKQQGFLFPWLGDLDVPADGRALTLLTPSLWAPPVHILAGESQEGRLVSLLLTAGCWGSIRHTVTRSLIVQVTWCLPGVSPGSCFLFLSLLLIFGGCALRFFKFPFFLHSTFPTGFSPFPCSLWLRHLPRGQFPNPSVDSTFLN